MIVRIGPVGRISRGHVLDSARAPLERKLREYDPQLYLSWNPKKLKGHGLWEVRRRPNLKTVKETIVAGGNTYNVLDYVENNFENHILDVPYLNYQILERLKLMDTWAVSTHGKDFVSTMESREEAYKEKIKQNALSERRYEIKQHMSHVRDLMDYTLSGGDPSLIANHWNP